jgi:hypothetical protein
MNDKRIRLQKEMVYLGDSVRTVEVWPVSGFGKTVLPQEPGVQNEEIRNERHQI